jgi:hypothetical protein
MFKCLDVLGRYRYSKDRLVRTKIVMVFAGEFGSKCATIYMIVLL